jgi:uncharacterized protein YjbI with pentapeptide repeats
MIMRWKLYCDRTAIAVAKSPVKYYRGTIEKTGTMTRDSLTITFEELLNCNMNGADFDNASLAEVDLYV